MGSQKKICSFPECGKPAVARGLCHGHYKQYSINGMESLVPLKPRWKGATCKVPGCDQPVRCVGYCSGHYSCHLTGRELVLVKSSLSATKFEDGLQVCTKCKQALPKDQFWADKRVKRGTLSQCKECMSKQYAGWVKQKPEARKKIDKKWRAAHKTELNARTREYYQANKPRIMEQAKHYLRKRRATDTLYRVKQGVRARLRQALKGNIKATTTMQLVGCTLAELKAHLESLFSPGMSWDNYGLYGWHIDHIMPCSSFDLLDPAQQAECFHYTNLQPLWAKDNLSKSDKVPTKETEK